MPVLPPSLSAISPAEWAALAALFLTIVSEVAGPIARWPSYSLAHRVLQVLARVLRLMSGGRLFAPRGRAEAGEIDLDDPQRVELARLTRSIAEVTEQRDAHKANADALSRDNSDLLRQLNDVRSRYHRERHYTGEIVLLHEKVDRALGGQPPRPTQADRDAYEVVSNFARGILDAAEAFRQSVGIPEPELPTPVPAAQPESALATDAPAAELVAAPAPQASEPVAS